MLYRSHLLLYLIAGINIVVFSSLTKSANGGFIVTNKPPSSTSTKDAGWNCHNNDGRILRQTLTTHLHRPSSTSIRNSIKENNDDDDKQHNDLILTSFFQNVKRRTLNLAAISILLLTTTLSTPPTLSLDGGVPHFDQHPNHHSALAAPLTENQQLVSDVWFAVTAQFFDPTYNNLTEDGWRAKKTETMAAVAPYGPDDDRAVAAAIQRMLSALGDPYTRFLPREKYEALTAYARGGRGAGVGGIGVQLLLDPREDVVAVMTVLEGGPAAKAGVKPGDLLVAVGGESTVGLDGEQVAAKTRGEVGSEIDVVVRRDGGDGDGDGKTVTLTVRRDNVKMNPVKASTFVSSRSGDRVGVITIPAFSQETPGQVVDALRLVRGSGGDADRLSAIAVDLRGNVGGYMPAGVDCSKLFLVGGRRIIAEVNRLGQISTAYYSDGIGAETTIPLYVVVDGRTASAAEIFSAALQDNRRAVVVGETKTFGKGRIQNLQPMGDGSGVAVTRARYVTPQGRDLHGVGITPNQVPERCRSEDSVAVCLEGIV